MIHRPRTGSTHCPQRAQMLGYTWGARGRRVRASACGGEKTHTGTPCNMQQLTGRVTGHAPRHTESWSYWHRWSLSPESCQDRVSQPHAGECLG